ncbi:MAG: hypothetical protein M3R55_08680 [Acidobacteriota bacterium]|nr:hypothetical protein [Acidobacteriota bacterium]
MKLRTLAFAFLLLAASSIATAAEAGQQGAPPGTPPQMPNPAGRAVIDSPATGPLKVFLDCQHECDFDFLRTNVAFVDWVRDRASSDIHVLVTTQTTGGGGLNWTLKFIGVGALAGVDESLAFSTASTDTSDARRKELARVVRLGVARYAVRAGQIQSLDVTFRPSSAAAPGAPQKDPWNYWVFSTSIGGNLGGERSTKNSSYRMNLSANRVTADWKINLSTNGNYNENTFDFEGSSTIRSVSRSWGVNSLVVKSLGARWSAGLRANLTGSTFNNQDSVLRVAPGVEFDVFPYAESTRRSWTFLYSAGPAVIDYEAETIFSKLKETIVEHEISSNLGLRQPWGSAGASVSFRQHLNNLERHRLSVFGSADVRLFKGFSFNVFGDYSRIRDQINLRKGAASVDEVLLRQRQLATGYRYFLGFGVSYRFGSIFNNVVNPRFGGSGGGGSSVIFF